MNFFWWNYAREVPFWTAYLYAMKPSFFNFLFLFLCAISPLFAQQVEPIYASETLKIGQLSPNTFVHISYLPTEDFGKVACNGMIVIHKGEALVFDTPSDSVGSAELINWLEQERKAKVIGVVATHFHDDCVAGLEAFHSRGIPSYGTFKTIELATAEGNLVPQNGFENTLNLRVGKLKVTNQFLGEGHTRDNVVSYVPSDRVLFGGCLIKQLKAGVGFIGDANIPAWPVTVAQVKSSFPKTAIVIPGHGEIGDSSLLDYTIQLFQESPKN